jgi:hypothetical protein
VILRYRSSHDPLELLHPERCSFRLLLIQRGITQSLAHDGSLQQDAVLSEQAGQKHARTFGTLLSNDYRREILLMRLCSLTQQENTISDVESGTKELFFSTVPPDRTENGKLLYWLLNPL